MSRIKRSKTLQSTIGKSFFTNDVTGTNSHKRIEAFGTDWVVIREVHSGHVFIKQFESKVKLIEEVFSWLDENNNLNAVNDSLFGG